ncbi:MAG TPA: hypothetical protein VIK86_04530 [Candidatus Paceibacterota bacterium]
MIISTFVIAISFVVFFYLFANIFVPLLFDIPATIKLGRKNIIKYKPVLKKYIITALSCSIIASIILALAYHFFIKYSFGFSISLFIGACLALLISSWKMAWLFSRYSDNYLKWLDFYRKDNSRYLETADMGIIDEALGGKSGELEKLTNKKIDKMFK